MLNAGSIRLKILYSLEELKTVLRDEYMGYPCEISSVEYEKGELVGGFSTYHLAPIPKKFPILFLGWAYLDSGTNIFIDKALYVEADIESNIFKNTREYYYNLRTELREYITEYIAGELWIDVMTPSAKSSAYTRYDEGDFEECFLALKYFDLIDELMRTSNV